MQIFLLYIGVVSLVIGVKLVYDARLIVNKYFSVTRKNSAVNFLKVLGTICSVFGIIIVSNNLGAVIF